MLYIYLLKHEALMTTFIEKKDWFLYFMFYYWIIFLFLLELLMLPTIYLLLFHKNLPFPEICHKYKRDGRWTISVHPFPIFFMLRSLFILHDQRMICKTAWYLSQSCDSGPPVFLHKHAYLSPSPCDLEGNLKVVTCYYSCLK